VHVRTAFVRVRAVEHRRAIRVTVYLDVGSDPLSGTVGIDDDEQRRFQGWIELAHAIDSAHAIGPAEHEQPPDRPG
jgi:hypothetical protein